MAWPVSSGDKTFTAFVVTIKARTLYTIGASNNAPDPGNVSFVDSETVNGTGTAWTLEGTPTPGSVHLYAEGGRLTVAGGDYTISGTSITTAFSWPAGSLLADYRQANG